MIFNKSNFSNHSHSSSTSVSRYLRFPMLAVLLFISGIGISQSGATAFFDATANGRITYGLATGLTNFNTLPGGDKLSLTFWVKWRTKDNGDSYANMFSLVSASNSNDGTWWAQHSNKKDKFEFAIVTTTGRSHIQSVTNPAEGVWYHVAMIYDGAKMYIYVNGLLDKSGGKTGNIPAYIADAGLSMGDWMVSYRRNFDGYMDEVSVWNIALTPAQINTMMSNPEGLTGVGYDATGLLGYWNFDDGTADDLTASNNNGIFESGGSTTLPIDLISFTGQFNNNAVVLDWTTASELNNDYFVVERATGNILEESNWSPIAKISGAGNTNILSEYMYLDNDVNSSESVYYYRIKQIDFDGQYSYSAVISVKSAMNHAIQVYPNPSTGNFKIVGLSKINNYNVEIYNSTGHLVRVYSSSENMNIDLSDQPIGIYLVKSGERVFRLIKE